MGLSSEEREDVLTEESAEHPAPVEDADAARPDDNASQPADRRGDEVHDDEGGMQE